MSKKSPSRLSSFRHAFSGLAAAFRSEPNLRLHGLGLAIAGGAGWYFRVSPGEWLAIGLASGLVITTEILHTSIETLTDLVSPGHHELAGKTKDLAAAAVLIAALTAAATGGLVFVPKAWSAVWS